MYKAKPSTPTTGWLIGTTAAAITSLSYLIPAIGVWQCIYEAPAVCINTQNISFGLSTSTTGMDSGWLNQVTYLGGGFFNTTRIFTVTDLTTTIYSLVWCNTLTGGPPGLFGYTLQCVRVA